ncbi:MAG: hypothetical protein WCZ23_17615 [Rhodospirillaceae bacterium]
MAFKPNYNHERAERDRLKTAKKAEKLKQQRERSVQRAAERDDLTTNESGKTS